MPKRGKRYESTVAKLDPNSRYALDEAMGLLKGASTAKFDESVDVAIRLGVNPRKADQMVRGAVSLPHGTGKPVRVLVFADGDAAKAAEDAGADFVGGDDMIKKIQSEGWTDFDKVVAVRSMMAKVGRIGRILGPRGLMPNPKTGTVVSPDRVGEVVREVKGGRVDFRVEKAGILHVPFGRSSMTETQLRENLLSLMGTIIRLKPSSAKGLYLKGVSVSSTMGPGIRIDTGELVRLSAKAR